jgi:hypothetical protein
VNRQRGTHHRPGLRMGRAMRPLQRLSAIGV